MKEEERERKALAGRQPEKSVDFVGLEPSGT